MNIKLVILMLVVFSCASAYLINAEVFSSKIKADEPEPACVGTKYSGAWFEVIIPDDFVSKPSMTSTTNDGYDSVWFENSKIGLELYLYSPQWGGMPSDLLNDSNIENVSEQLKTNREFTVNIRTVVYRDGTFGSFTTKEAVDYPSHLTTGHRSQQRELSLEREGIYTCFVQSIQQFMD